jgi:glycine/D-amino acid oxidase-like deaminating enzyme
MNVGVLPDAPRLRKKLNCDVAVVGAGIAGLSTAHELTTAGLQVVVLAPGSMAGGMTSRTRRTSHRSQLAPDGAVLNGPAVSPLERAAVQRWTNAA